MVDLDRRELLQAAGALGASFAFSSFAVAQTVGTATANPRFFTAAEVQFVEAAVDRLIPPDSQWVGALQAGVPHYIDLQLAGPYGKGERLYLDGPIRPGTPQQGYQLGLTPAELYRRALSAILDDLANKQIVFHSVSEADKDNYLTTLERGQLSLAGIPSAVFFETLLANTIEGFFADPAYGGNRNMVGWRMIGFPGAYAAYLGIYTHHGLKYAREPIGMTGRTVGHDH